jgi:hypothetical protein
MTTSHFQRNACIERMTPRVGPDRGQVLPDGKLIVSSVVHRMGNGWASPQHDAITKAEQNDLRRSIKNLLATPGAVEFRLDYDDEVIAAEVPTDTPVLPGEFLAKLKEEKPATTIGPQLSQDDQLLKRAGEDIGASGLDRWLAKSLQAGEHFEELIAHARAGSPSFAAAQKIEQAIRESYSRLQKRARAA